MSRFPDLSLTAVIPAYNEERLLEATVRRAVASLARSLDRFELLLVDDASTDGTRALSDALARELPSVRVVHNERNLKQGGCLRLGFRLARHDLVTHNAVDYPFDFDDLPLLIRHFPAADVVVATRRSYPGVSASRMALSSVNRVLIRLLFGIGIRDCNFVQVYKRSVLAAQACFSTATNFVTVEHIVRTHHAGHRIVAVPCAYHPREVGSSSSGTLRHMALALRDMARLRLELFRRPSRAATWQGNPS
jgi:glycosyltransferase involved in cell wall biosynthesis